MNQLIDKILNSKLITLEEFLKRLNFYRLKILHYVKYGSSNRTGIYHLCV